MSQVVRILGARVKGSVYVGQAATDGGTQTDAWSSNPDRVVWWLWDGYRSRFNQRRALRSKPAYEPDPDHPGWSRPVVDSDGVLLMVPVGREPGTDEKKSEFKHSHPWAAAIPDLMLQHADRQENRDWWAALKRRRTLRGKKHSGGAMPLFRSRKHDPVRFGVFTGGPKCLSPQGVVRRTGRKSAVVVIRGMNPAGKTQPGQPSRWSVIFRVRWSQPIRPATSIEVDWTAKKMVFVSDPPERPHEPTGKTVGLDLGVAHTITTSDGVFYDQPATPDLDAKIQTRQKSLARKRRINNPANQKNWTPTRRYLHERALLAKAYAARTRRLQDWRQKTTTLLVDLYDLIVVENLKIKNMTASAKGTADQPGRNVRAKAGLNRGLASASPGLVRQMLAYKTSCAKVGFVEINPAYTSQECSHCHHVAADNRESQAVFCCVQCGCRMNADMNAAVNIREHGIKDRPLIASKMGGPGHGPQEILPGRPTTRKGGNPRVPRHGKPANHPDTRTRE